MRCVKRVERWGSKVSADGTSSAQARTSPDTGEQIDGRVERASRKSCGNNGLSLGRCWQRYNAAPTEVLVRHNRSARLKKLSHDLIIEVSSHAHRKIVAQHSVVVTEKTRRGEADGRIHPDPQQCANAGGHEHV